MDFKSDLASISMDEELDLHHLVEVYNQNLAEILDIHAPLKSKTLKITHIQPWFNDKIKREILLGRRLAMEMATRSYTVQPPIFLLSKEAHC